jgi:hypothetical protein
MGEVAPGSPQVEVAIRRAALEVLADSAKGLFLPDHAFIRLLTSARTASGDEEFLKGYKLLCEAFERLDKRLARHLVEQCGQNVDKKRGEIVSEVRRVCHLAGVQLPGATGVQWFPQPKIKGSVGAASAR